MTIYIDPRTSRRIDRSKRDDRRALLIFGALILIAAFLSWLLAGGMS
jgi:hypothetical protein